MTLEVTDGNRGIVILGMHRGGTSLLANLVHCWGAYADKETLTPGDVYNPLGYWEPRPVVKLNEDLLAAVQSRWCVPPANNAIVSLAAMARREDFRNRALNLLSAARADGRPWFWKDPRLSILLPFWRQLWGKVVYLVSVREPNDIAESLRHRDGLSASASMLLWQKYMSDILADEQVQSTGAFFAYENVLTDPKRECGRLCRLLDQRFGLHRPDADYRIEQMANVIDTRLWRNRGNNVFLSNDIQTRLRDALFHRSAGADENSLEDFPMQSDWREILEDEQRRRSPWLATAQCRVYWRDAYSEYSDERSAVVQVALNGAPQSVEIAIPRLDHGGALCIRIDLTDRPATVVLTAMEIRDSERNVIWAWDGRTNSITALSHNEVASCVPLRGETGCVLQLHGFDPWFEIALDAGASAATVGGALVLIQCTCSASVEYALFANGTRTAEAISRLEHLEGVQARLQQETGLRFQHLEAEQGDLRQDTISRFQHFQEHQTKLRQEVTSRLEQIEKEQANLHQTSVSRIKQVEEEQANLRQEVVSRLQRLEAEQAELHRMMQEILNSRIWKTLVALGGAVLRLTNGRGG